MSEVTSMDLVDPVNLSLDDLIKLDRKSGRQQKGADGQQPKKGRKKRDGVKQATPGGQLLQQKGGQKAEQAMKKGGRKRENAFNKGRGIEAMDVDTPSTSTNANKKKKKLKLNLTVNGQKRLSTGSNGNGGNKPNKGGQQGGQKGGQRKGGQGGQGGPTIKVPTVIKFQVPKNQNFTIEMVNPAAAKSPSGGDSLNLSGSGVSKKKRRPQRQGPKANAGASMQGSGRVQRTVILQQGNQNKRQANFNASRNIITAAGGGGGGGGGKQGGKQGGQQNPRRVVIKKGGSGNGGGNRRK